MSQQQTPLVIPEGMKPCEGYKCWCDAEDGIYHQHITSEGAPYGSKLCSNCHGKGYVPANHDFTASERV